ncbi:MAG TPA: hypothetical protein VGC72_18825 [Candidatus Elarobacter sp.]
MRAQRHSRREVRIARIMCDACGRGKVALGGPPTAQPLRGEGAIGEKRRFVRDGAERAICYRVGAFRIARATADEQEKREPVGSHRGRGIEPRSACVRAYGTVDVSGAQDIVAARDERRGDVTAKQHRGTG